MPETQGLDQLPQATIEPPKRARIGIIWIIPILAAIVAIGIAVQRILNEGPTIVIVFTAVEGIEAGKTFIKYKDVNIGQVKAIRLTEDFKKVEVTAKMEKHAADLMVQDAKFWIVSPQVTLSGISGLGTLLGGNYIGFEPGKSKEQALTFTGLDFTPVLSGVPGRKFILNTDELGSLSIGSPIYFRRIPVGQVTGYDLQPDGKSMRIDLFVKAPYDRFVTASTRFWNVSGIGASIGADGLKVRTESLVAMLAGGVAFESPPLLPTGAVAADGAVFKLYSDQALAMKAPDALAKRYVLHFNEALRGLSVGAPVTLLGLATGEVTSIGLELNPANGDIRPRVEILIYPERTFTYASSKGQAQPGAAVATDLEKRLALVRHLVEDRGLRAQLKSGSLVTGQLYVSLDYHPNARKAKIDLSQDVPEIPVVPSALADLQEKLGGIITKIDQMPLEAIGKGVKKELENLDTALTSASKLISRTDDQLVPGLKTAAEDLHRALSAVEHATNSARSSLLQSDSATQQDLRDALQEFTRAARSLRALTEMLEQQPTSVIRGKSASGEK